MSSLMSKKYNCKSKFHVCYQFLNIKIPELSLDLPNLWRHDIFYRVHIWICILKYLWVTKLGKLYIIHIYIYIYIYIYYIYVLYRYVSKGFQESFEKYGGLELSSRFFSLLKRWIKEWSRKRDLNLLNTDHISFHVCNRNYEW